MPSAWGWGVDGVTGLEGNFLGIYPYQKANLGVGGSCAGGHLDTYWCCKSRSVFLLRFNQECWAGKDPAFPTCMNFFFWGRWKIPLKLSFSLGLFPVFSRDSFAILSPLLLFMAVILESKQSVGRRQWHPTPVLLPGKSHGWRSLVGCSPWGC